MPTTFASKMHAIQSATHSLLLRLGREPTHDEVAAELGIHRSALNALLTIGGRCASLDRLISDSGETTFVEALAAPGNPEDDDEQLQDLRSRIETLPDHLARLVHARYHHQLPPSELAAQERLTPIELRRHLKVAVGILTASCRPSNAPRCQAELISGDQLALFVLPQTERHPGRPRVERRSRELPSMGQVEQGALALV